MLESFGRIKTFNALCCTQLLLKVLVGLLFLGQQGTQLGDILEKTLGS